MVCKEGFASNSIYWTLETPKKSVQKADHIHTKFTFRKCGVLIKMTSHKKNKKIYCASVIDIPATVEATKARIKDATGNKSIADRKVLLLWSGQ